MANKKSFQLPNGQLLNAKTITNLYLYLQDTTPVDDELVDSNLIRPELDFSSVPQNATNFSSILPANADVANIAIDAVPYMSSGPGRFANGSQFDLVRAFFGLGKDEMLTDNGRNFLDESVTLPSGTYTKDDINRLLFQRKLGGLSSSLELRNYRDSLSETDADGNGVSEYAELVYIWNSTAFAIDDNARFVVNPNGTKEIQDFVIQPNLFQNPIFRENFDFATANPIIEAGSELLLEPLVDPSDIGRQAFIDFYGRQNVPKHDPDQIFSPGVYDASDFQQDLITEADNFEPTSVGVIREVRNQAKYLFDEGTTRFTFNDKPIFYGTVDNDVLTASNLVNAQIQTAELNAPRNVTFGNGLVLLGGKGNDTLTGDAFIGIFGNTDDILIGHERNDNLDGGGGEDTAVYFDSYTDVNGNLNYDITTNTNSKITTVDHLNSGIDGTDTLKDVEWAEFKGGQQVNISSNPSEILIASRMIPLPLTDGVEATEFIGAIDTTPSPNPNDLPTPPNATISAPVAMLDGDVDYTLNISPYQPDTEYNISYIIDTSASMDAEELQQTKDAYTDLTNYFIDSEIAENINFGVVQFSRNATPYFNLTAEEAISTIQGLTASTNGIEGTKYNDALYQGFNFLSQSPKDALNTTNIAYFVSDGRSRTNYYDPYDPTYHQDAQNLRRFANVQAFGIVITPKSRGSNSKSAQLCRF